MNDTINSSIMIDKVIASSVNDVNGNIAVSSKQAVVSKKRIIDETLLPSDEAEKLLARRAYNRECASRARGREKRHISELEKQVAELREDKESLRRSIATMEQQISLLKRQNQVLLLKQMTVNRGYQYYQLTDSASMKPLSVHPQLTALSILAKNNQL
jgi:TolA-binding protein